MYARFKLWDRTHDGRHREFLGCGAAFLPAESGQHTVDVVLWKPTLQTNEFSALTGSPLIHHYSPAD
jgi:hypothetical protein